MVTKLVENQFDANKKYVEIACASTDVKPTAGIANGSLALETDTGDVYALTDGTTPEWNKIAELGGGS